MATLSKDDIRRIIANRPEGTTPEGVVAALRENNQLEGYESVDLPPPPQLKATRSHANMYPVLQDWLRGKVSDALPTAGGFAGGLMGSAAGPAGAIGGAALGGAFGESLRQADQGQWASPSDLGIQGATQGASEVLGLGLGKMATSAATPLLRRALSVSPGLARRFGSTPEAIADIVGRNRLPLNQGGENAAQGMANTARTARDQVIASTPGKVGAGVLAQAAIRQSESNLGRPLTNDERAVIVAQVQREADRILTESTHGAVQKAGRGTPAKPASSLVDQYGQPAIPAQEAVPAPPSRYTPREVNQVKMVAAKNARPAYTADKAAMSVAADPTLSKQIASGARSRLNKIPGVKELNTQLRDAIQAKLAIREALSKSPQEWTPLHIGPLTAGFKVPRDKMMSLSLMLSSPTLRRVLRQSPRALDALVTELTSTSEPDQTASMADSLGLK